MGSPAELSLDYKPNNYLMIQKAQQGDQPVDQTEKIQDFLTRLEEERLKIEAFKRELPLCMQLLNNAVETYRQQLEMHQTKQGSRPVLEEFIPLKNTEVDGSNKASNAPSEKASWMVSAQLWSQANDVADSNNHQQQLISYNTASAPTTVKEEVMISPKLALIDNKPTRNGGAFLPFSKDKNKASSASAVVGSSAVSRGLAELALASSEQKSCSAEEKSEHHLQPRREVGNGNCKSGGEAQGKGSSNSADGQGQTQTHRKARRCWSPDLHRRFVNALQILGGSQVATPKQIRELMKVDGLTNDEVKSHLQKYRLHTRRPIPVAQPTATAAPQLVVLGGIWVPPEYATSAAGQAIYGAHPPPHYCTAAPVPQEFYTAAAAHHHHHPHHHVQHPVAVHRSSGAISHKGRASRSPESEVRSGGERSESIEEEAEREDDDDNIDEEEDDEEFDASAVEKEKKVEDGSVSGDVSVNY